MPLIWSKRRVPGYGLAETSHREAGGLRFEFSALPDSTLLEEFFQGYDRSFVLANEKETLEGIRECLELNLNQTGLELTRQYGLAREFVAVARDASKPGAPAIGGANFITFVTDRRCPYLRQPAILTHLNYVFVLPEFRGAGYLRKIVDHVGATAMSFAEDAVRSGQVQSGLLQRFIPAMRTGTPRSWIFIEQNDPYRLTEEEYARDTQTAGVDQFSRLAIWSGLNARLVDFPYVQPPLSAAQEADDTLALAVLGALEDTTLDACVLRAHLERYFAVTVLKGKISPLEEPSAKVQLDTLASLCRQRRRLALLEIDRPLLRKAFEARANGETGHVCLADLLNKQHMRPEKRRQ
jgi:GNAT superfamily N-acetyltransferase